MKRALLAASAVVLGLATIGAGPAPGAAAITRPPVGADAHAPIGGTVPGVGEADTQLPGAATERFRQMRQAVTGDEVRTLADLHADFGSFPRPPAFGAMATHTVSTSMLVSVPDEVVYGPTMMPGRGSCLEITTIYYGSVRFVGAWNWCMEGPSTGWGKLTVIDAAFLADYGTTLSGRPAYSVKANLTDAATNTWTSYLYNYRTAAWDVFYTSSGTSRLSPTSTGWDMFEIYTNTDPVSGNGYYCADSRGVTFESSGIQWSFTPGTWEPASGANSYVSPSLNPDPVADFHCSTMTFTMNGYVNWRVSNTPAPTGPVKSAIPNKCMDVNGGNTASGTKIQIWNCIAGGHPNQTWTLPADKTMRAFGKCLDVISSGTANGTKVQLWTCNGTGAQRWTYNASTGALVNTTSGKCLDDPAGSTTNGTQLQIYTCNGTNPQRWTIPS